MKKISNILLLTVISFNLFVLPASAIPYEYAQGFWPAVGLPDNLIGSMPYYEDPSVDTKNYELYSQSARYEWDKATGADIDFYRVSSYSAATTRIYALDYDHETYWGKMIPFKRDGSRVTDQELWFEGTEFYKVHIILNDHSMDRSQLSASMRLNVAVHEYGHMLGLRHQRDGVNSVMDPGYSDISRPTSLDYLNVNWQY